MVNENSVIVFCYQESISHFSHRYVEDTHLRYW